jgi:hypothetical protein
MFDLEERDFEELEDLEARSFEELEARSPKGGKGGKGGGRRGGKQPKAAQKIRHFKNKVKGWKARAKGSLHRVRH